MPFSRTKKVAVFLSLSAIALLLIVNYRIPFFKQDIGFWSVGFGQSDSFPKEMKVDPKNIFSIAKLTGTDSTSEFLADPFFIRENGKYYLFFEHKHTTYHPAEIAVLVSSDGKNYEYKGSVLREKFHLSYPQVFKHKGRFYMLPESQAGNNVMLYTTDNFPYGWKVCDTLIANIKLKDPSIYLSDSLNIIAASDKNMNMFLYRADSLFGKWTLHKRPKVLMGNESRCGGRFFNDGKGLILPVQNSGKSYGSGLSLYRLTFKDGNYSVKKEKDHYLKGQTGIPEFAGGMHQLDIQKIDGKYYYVYDGINLKTQKEKFQPYSSVKMNLYDLKNWFYQLTNN